MDTNGGLQYQHVQGRLEATGLNPSKDSEFLLLVESVPERDEQSLCAASKETCRCSLMLSYCDFNLSGLNFLFLWKDFFPSILKLPSWYLSFFQIPKLDQVTFPHGTSAARRHWAFAAPSLKVPAPVDDLRCHARYPKTIGQWQTLKVNACPDYCHIPLSLCFLTLDVTESCLLKVLFNPWLACFILFWPVIC